MQKPTGVVRYLLLALILAIGVALAWGTVWASLWIAVQRQRAVKASMAEPYEQFVVRGDGTAAVATTSRVNYENQKWRTLDGQPMERGQQLQAGNLPGPIQLENSVLRGDWTSRIVGWADGQTSPERWYFIDDAQTQGQAWFEGFDMVTKQRIGFLGRHGLRTERLNAQERFPFDSRLKNSGGSVSGWGYWGSANAMSFGWPQRAGDRIPGWRFYLVSQGSLWEIDVRQHTVRALLHDASLISAAVVEQAVPANSQPQGLLDQHVAARSADRLWIVNPRTGATKHFPLRPDLQDDFLELYELSDGLLLHASDRRTSFAARSPRLVWLDREGKVVRELPNPVKQAAVSSNEDWPQIVTACPIPVLLGIGVFVADPLDKLDHGVASSYPTVLAGAPDRWKRLIILVTFVALAAAGWCYRRHRSYGQPAAAAWFVFVLLLGLPGLLAYLAHRRWPVCLPCPACGRSVPRDRDACRACGQVFPPPPAKGIEVFS